MADQRIHGGCSVELRQVFRQKDEQLQRTHVVFDRYNRTRASRILTRCQRGFKEYKLTMNAPLPQQQVVLSVTKNEVQLIDLMCEELQKLDDVPLNISLVITGVTCTNGSEKQSVVPKN